MADISSNDEFDMDPGEVQEDDVSSNDSFNGFESNFQNDEEYSYVQSEIRSDGSVDYSSNFANIENLFKFQIAVIIGFLLCVCFIVGWKHD